MATLTGRITKDARKVEKNGKSFIAFDFVENDSYKKKSGEKVKQSFFFNCAMGNAEKLMPYIVKGKIVSLTGNISARCYTAKNGDARASVNVSVKTLNFLGGSGDTKKTNEPIEAAPITNTVDDLPF